MSHERKISVVVLGSEESLKRALITNILANDSPRKRNALKKTEIYEHETYRVMCTPNLLMSSAREDIKDLYDISPHPDMSLLIVKEGFSPEEVWKQIDELSRITGKPTEEFIVVLPLSYKHPERYRFKFYTMEQLFSELTRLAKDRSLMPAKTSYAESTSHTSMETAGGGYNFTAPKKTPKERKISVVVLGSEESLKKALITIILANDSPRKTNVLKKTEIYEHETYRVMCTPNLSSTHEDIKELYAISPHPDMSLLIVKEGLSPEEVWKQLEELSRITGKPTEEFMVVLPLSYTHPEPYLFRFCTMEQLFSELTRLAKDRSLMPANTSYAESTSHTPMETAGGGYNNERSTAPKKTLKGKHPATRVNLVLLGMAGTGKSASGNTILGGTFFTSRASSDLVTRECHAKDAVIGRTRRRVRIIDTPDIFDDDVQQTLKDQHVMKCRELCEQEPCVYLLVMHISRFTDGERNILNKLAAAFGNRVHEQTVILFTRGQDLKQGDMSFEEFLHNSSSDLKEIVAMCGNRCVLFENNASHSDQVERLMQTVVKILK